ncbi:hypothetical protein FJY63_02110 [Candidatus Sumerlaeota bacterium]|nr:hypothetical protein [Candidatus Sumerlaeota bacterium]
MRRCYSYSGLHIASEIEIPEWSPFETTDRTAAPDVFIRLEKAEERPAQDDDCRPVIEPTCHDFRVPEVGRYRVTDGREIVVTPTPDAGMREIRLFLLGSAWGALCYQRGVLILHASVVQIGDGAVALCGATGCGKSTIAAWLLAKGHRLVSDGLCRFELSAERPPRAHPAAPRLKLWRDTLEALGWSADGLERDHFRMDKFHLPIVEARSPQPLPLRAIYLLEWGEPDIVRLAGATALRRLVQTATYRGDLLEPMGQAAAHWQRCAELLRRVPVWEFRRPRDWSALEEAMNLLSAGIMSTCDSQLPVADP